MTVRPYGEVIVEEIDEATGLVLTRFGPFKNQFIYEGADILGRLIAGQTQYVPNYCYIEFQNGGSPPSITPALDEGRSYYAGLETSGPPLDRDYLRVPLQFSPALDASDATRYATNRATFVVMSTGVLGVAGLEFSASAVSQVYGYAIVSSPDVDDRSDDLVYARVYPATSITKGATSQIQVRWPYEFTV